MSHSDLIKLLVRALAIVNFGNSSCGHLTPITSIPVTFFNDIIDDFSNYYLYLWQAWCIWFVWSNLREERWESYILLCRLLSIILFVFFLFHPYFVAFSILFFMYRYLYCIVFIHTFNKKSGSFSFYLFTIIKASNFQIIRKISRTNTLLVRLKHVSNLLSNSFLFWINSLVREVPYN